MIRVVLAEDHHLVRQGLRAVLDKAEEVKRPQGVRQTIGRRPMDIGERSKES